MKKHTCRTYFAIYGAKDAAALLSELGLENAQVRCNDSIMIGFNDTYNVDINEMFRVTLQSRCLPILKINIPWNIIWSACPKS